MKRIIAFGLMLIFLLSNTAISVSAGEGSYNETYYTEAGKLLNKLGITSGNNGTETGTPITRIDFVKMAVDAISKGRGNVYGGKTSYTDVSASDSGYVCFAVDAGLLPSGTRLYPDAAADLDFAKMVLTGAAGYEISGSLYKKTAIEIGLTVKLRSIGASDFTKGDANVMIYNLLISESVKRTSIDKYEIADETLLEALYDLEYAKGCLSADENSAMEGNPCGDGQIRINVLRSSEVLDLSYEEDVSELLGRYVKVYYNSDYEAVLLSALYSDDIKVEIGGDEFSGYDSASRKLSYKVYSASSRWESASKEAHEKIPASADIIYNGRFTLQHDFVYDILENGSGYNVDRVLIIDSDKDGKTDLLKVEAYKTVMVKSVSANELIIKDKMTDEIIDIDGKTSDGTYREVTVSVFDKSGAEASFSAIKENTVISVFEALGAPYEVKIVVTSSVIEGKVTAKNKGEEPFTISVDGFEYPVSKAFEPYMDEIISGNEYTLYFDHNGFVSGYAFGVSSVSDAGGVVKLVIPEESEGSLEFRLFNINGEFVTYRTADKWSVNGKRVDTDQSGRPVYKDDTGTVVDVMNMLKTAFVQYKLDSADNIKAIITAKKNAKAGELGYVTGMNNPEAVFKNPGDYQGTHKMNGKYIFPRQGYESAMNFMAVSTKTKIIKMPSANITSDRESYFSVVSSLKNDEDASYVGYTFGGENQIVADIVVMVNESSSDPTDSDYYAVKDICQAVNQNDEVGYKLTLVSYKGGEQTITTEKLEFPGYNNNTGEPTGEMLDISKGDVIKYGTNSAGDASSFIMMYDVSTDVFQPVNQDKFYVSKRLVKGSIYSINGNNFSYVFGDITDPSSIRPMVGFAKNVIIVDMNAQDSAEDFMKIGTVADLVSYVEDPNNYDSIIFGGSYGEVSVAIAYK